MIAMSLKTISRLLDTIQKSLENSKKRGNAQMDWFLYRYRYLVENAFMKTKRFRAIATRYDNLAGNYEATVSLAFTMMWLPMSVD